MKVLYCGDYDPGYPRHHVLIRGMRAHGIEVVEAPVVGKGIALYVALWNTIHGHPDVDVVFVPYSNSRFVWFVRLCTLKPIVWNAFYSLYDNWIYDRQLAHPVSFKAFWYWFLDWICCQAAHRVVLETNEDIKYFVRTFGISSKKFLRVFVGFNEDIFIPRGYKKQGTTFAVEFHGKYIPVQGVEHIIDAAVLLKEHTDIHFTLIGSGQTYQSIRQRATEHALTNVTFVERVPLESIPEYIANADVCIGLLGDIPRIEQAIPNKVYEAAAMKRPSITARTRAVEELFTDGRDIILVERGNPQALAEKILSLKNDPSSLERIGEAAYETVHARAISSVLGGILKEALDTVVR